MESSRPQIYRNFIKLYQLHPSSHTPHAKGSCSESERYIQVRVNVKNRELLLTTKNFVKHQKLSTIAP